MDGTNAGLGGEWWAALLAQAQANRDLAAALLRVVPYQSDCGACPPDQLEGWYAAQEASSALRVAENIVAAADATSSLERCPMGGHSLSDGAGGGGQVDEAEDAAGPEAAGASHPTHEHTDDTESQDQAGTGCQGNRRHSDIAVPSPPRAAWGAPAAWFDLGGKHSDGARTPSTYGEGGGWHGVPDIGGGVGQFTQLPGADGGVAGCKAQVIVGGAAIQMNTLPRPPEVADGRHAQGGKGTALASELPRPPEAAGGHGVADGDGLLAAGLPRPPEADDWYERARLRIKLRALATSQVA